MAVQNEQFFFQTFKRIAKCRRWT